jgi:hypothetical protein
MYRSILPVMERRMSADFPERLQEWASRSEFAKARREEWQKDVRTAQKAGKPPPMPPLILEEPEPMQPRLIQSDVTIEKVALLLAGAAPKGLLVLRDELAGWLLGLDVYNDSARAFWIECYGGRPYKVDRVKHPQPIEIARLAVALHGSIQPPRLAQVMREADDGLLARFCWFWPDVIPFRLASAVPNIDFAIGAFDRLRLLELMSPSEPGSVMTPVLVALVASARPLMEQLGRKMQERQETAGGLLVSALGKARGLALRLALVIEILWWAGEDGFAAPPTQISERAFLAAAALVADYLMPMAERVYGDAAASLRLRNLATLARWIVKARPSEVHVRQLQRGLRLPGLGEAPAIHEACQGLIEAGWLAAPAALGIRGRPRAVFHVRPELWEALS